VVAGCTCAAGFNGTMTPSTIPPYVTAPCTPVGCPPDSSGTNVVAGCRCTLTGTVVATSSAPFYSSTCAVVSRRSCNAYFLSNPALASGTFTIDLDDAGPLAPFQVYCDMTTGNGGWTLVDVRSGGVPMFTEPSYNPLLLTTGTGRVSQIWDLANTNFPFTQIRFTNGASYAIATYSSAQTLSGLNAANPTYVPTAGPAVVTTNVVSSVAPLNGFYIRAQSGNNGPYSDSSDWAVFCFADNNIAAYGDAWDINRPIWLLAGNDNSYDSMANSDVNCAAGLAPNGDGCHWYSTCPNLAQPVYVWLR